MIAMRNSYEIPEHSLEPPEEKPELEEFDEDRFFEEKRYQEMFGEYS